jgi:hypothetical protein
MKDSITYVTQHDEFGYGSRLLSDISKCRVAHACIKENFNVFRSDLNTQCLFNSNGQLACRVSRFNGRLSCSSLCSVLSGLLSKIKEIIFKNKAALKDRLP